MISEPAKPLKELAKNWYQYLPNKTKIWVHHHKLTQPKMINPITAMTLMNKIQVQSPHHLTPMVIKAPQTKIHNVPSEFIPAFQYLI